MNSHVDPSRWVKLSFPEQMGNIGSEVGRAILARRRGDKTAQDTAIIRALELFDITHPTRLSARREVRRARESFLTLFYDNYSESDARKLDAYFTSFSIFARANR